MADPVAGAGVPHEYRVLDQVERFDNPVFTLVSDTVVMPGGGSARRDYLRHVGAVGAVAIDEQDRVVLVRQYRQPLGRRLWELPAGLIDVAGEPLVDTARRELAEEADLVAGRWDVLVDLNPTPGCSNEYIRLFLARDLSEVAPDRRHVREHEEADLTIRRVDLDEAVAMVFRGEITNASCAAGVLAAVIARGRDWSGLRPISAPVRGVVDQVAPAG